MNIALDEPVDAPRPPKETISNKGDVIPDNPSGEDLLIKTRQVADSKKQKPLNVLRRYVRPHPAICQTPGCGRDLMVEYISGLDSRKFDLLFGTETHRESVSWDDLTQDLKDQLTKALKRHQATHDLGDYGPIRASEVQKKAWTGSKRGMRR